VKVFVTGGTGFVGSHLIDQLLAQNAEVRCLVRNPAKAEKLFPSAAPTPIPGDLENTRALEDGCDGVDVVYHIAALVAARSDQHFHQVNVDATARVLRAAQRAGKKGVRFVYVSSLAAAGPVARGSVLSDPEAQRPVTNYGRSKLAGEKLVTRSDLDWTVLRPPAVYGPRDTEMFKIFKLSKTGLAPVFGDGYQELSLIHVDDLASALIAASGEPCGSRIYYPAHREIVTTRELVTEIYRAVRGEPVSSAKKPHVIALPGFLTRAILGISGGFAGARRKATLLTADKANEFLAPAWACDPTQLETDTGWKAKIDIATGTRSTAQWYRENSWL
jgi:dihydroflavonol-4-reductase